MNKQEASRFLSLATLGADESMINSLATSGTKSSWIDAQLAISPQEFSSGVSIFYGLTNSIWESFKTKIAAKHPSAIGDSVKQPQILPYWYYWRMAFWDTTLKCTSGDHLRHKLALALSEILVISDQSNLELNSLGLSSYYDILYKDAFNSYEDILYQIAIHPCMGIYLTHMNNPKAQGNNHPDENFAREILQLFTIGLHKLDADGEAIANSPTYDGDDIRELAKVFTGLKPSRYWDGWDASKNQVTTWGNSKNTIPFINMHQSMVMENSQHDTSAKSLIDGTITLASGQDGLVEIREFIKQICRHHNTGFFIANKLIQFFVKSNPSKEYVKRVATVFKVEKNGKVGHLGDVIKAILTDTEASTPKKFKSPVQRCFQLLNAFEVKNDINKFYVLGEELLTRLTQHPLSAPTVFNFYLPDHMPNGAIQDAGLVAPEFQIHNAATSIDYINLMYSWFFGDYIMMVSDEAHGTRFDIPENRYDVLKDRAPNKLKFDFTREIALAARPDLNELIDHVSLKLIGRDLSSQMKNQITDAVSLYRSNHLWVVQTVCFMVSISPEFCVLE